MLLKISNSVNAKWANAQAQHSNCFVIPVNGKHYIIENKCNSFSIYNKQHKLIVSEVSNTEDLSNCLVMLSNCIK